ncbi:MAG: hypothetical protein DID92_2727745349 [Candidatus Nitrotoga sp. SPKER]|nr:MAG: hypothetical protein DID92_2727745349 [Candidatus Nitrotoga sp. SPKER]
MVLMKCQKFHHGTCCCLRKLLHSLGTGKSLSFVRCCQVRFFAFVACMGVAFLVAGCNPFYSVEQSNIERGYRLIEHDQYDQAISTFEQARMYLFFQSPRKPGFMCLSLHRHTGNVYVHPPLMMLASFHSAQSSELQQYWAT